MIKNINSYYQNFSIRKKYILKRQILHFGIAAIFTAFLFAIIQSYPITPYDDTVSKKAPYKAEPAYSETVSNPVLESISSSDTTSVSKSVMPDKEHLLSVIDALPTKEDTLLSSSDGFCSTENKELLTIIDSFHEEERSLSFILLDLYSENIFCLNPEASYYSASTIKGPYVAALNKFSPEIVSDNTKDLMKNTIMWSSNEDFETLHFLYGNDALYEMTAYTDVSESIIDKYNWYPYLTPKELTKLWIGIYWYFFEDTNENSKWCQTLYTDSVESFIGSALSKDYTVYSKPGWYIDWEDVSRNDAGILLTDDHAYILTIMSDAFDSYEELEELAAILGTSLK